MTSLPKYVQNLVFLHDGEIKGAKRLQKIAYILERKNLGLGLKFDYHLFGTFCSDLAFASDDAVRLKLIESRMDPNNFGNETKIFSMVPGKQRITIDDPNNQKRKDLIGLLFKYRSVILELATAELFLRQNGYPRNSWDMVKRHKPKKAIDPNVNKAKELLEEIGLAA